ncbi:MAG: glycosyl transferase [Spirochaetales bacterium]|nr:glycosyl transferase [Spirochaetales bacterium]
MTGECISIIVPVYRELDEINPFIDYLDTLLDVETAELIIVDGDHGGTNNVIENRARRFAIKKLISSKGRGQQLHAGALQAACNTFLFLHVDSRPPRSAIRAVRFALETYSAGAFDLYVASRSYTVRAIAAIASLRSRISRIPYGDQSHFMRAETYFSVGGYPMVPIMEDVALMAKFKDRGIRLTILKQFTKNSDRRWRKEGPLRSTWRNWYLRLRYALGADVSHLARLYRPHGEI